MALNLSLNEIFAASTIQRSVLVRDRTAVTSGTPCATRFIDMMELILVV